MFFFSKHNEECKTGALEMCMNFHRFFERRSLDDFHEYKMSMGLYDGESPLFNFDVVMTYKPTNVLKI